MSAGRGSESRKISTNIALPQVKIPRVLTGSRNPPGWGATEINLRAAGASGAASPRKPEPAGDPPPGWTGTRPEWAMRWGLEKNGLVPGEDFLYRPQLTTGWTSSGEAEVDFLVPGNSIAIEIQGRFWHYGQGTRKIINDIMRVSQFALMGLKIIFVDEPDALSDPIYYAKEALEGNDHSHVNRIRSSTQV